ncbi:hypothetical protein Vi05172_g13000 [Venturia inaequalis]|nr:hypothetical protein Vi05172_g13000 [Venturia inaequalis]
MKRKTPAVASTGVKRQKVVLAPPPIETHNTDSLPKQASLLGIPVELRLQILELLLPDIHHTPDCDHTSWAARYFNTQLAHFTDVKLTISLTLQHVVSNIPGRRSRIYQKFMDMKHVVSELAHALAALEGLTDIDVTVNVHFEEKLSADMEEALGMDIAELLEDEHMKELIGQSVCTLLGPFDQIHNLKTADYGVAITGLKNPPVITWNSGLVKLLNEVALQSISRRSGRARGNSSARP